MTKTCKSSKLQDKLRNCEKVLWVGSPSSVFKFRDPMTACAISHDNVLAVQTTDGEIYHVNTSTPEKRVFAAALINKDDKTKLATKIAEIVVGYELAKSDLDDDDIERITATTKAVLDWAGDKAKIAFSVWVNYPPNYTMTSAVDDKVLRDFCRAVSGADIYDKVMATIDMLPFLHIKDVFDSEEMILALTECVFEDKTLVETLASTLYSVPPRQDLRRYGTYHVWGEKFINISEYTCDDGIMCFMTKTSRDKVEVTTEEIDVTGTGGMADLAGRFSDLWVFPDVEVDTELCFDTQSRLRTGPVSFRGPGFAVCGHDDDGNPIAIVVQFDDSDDSDGSRKITRATVVTVK